MERILASDAYTRNVVRGVVPRDGLPSAASYPAAFVCNTHASNKEGQHWISMYLTKDRCGVSFDSYGLPPQHDEFVNFLRDNCPNWTFNNKTLRYDACLPRWAFPGPGIKRWRRSQR